MRLTWTSTRDDSAMHRWDYFLQASERGHYAQLSTWLASYAAYGFSVDVLLAEEAGQIVGGAGVIGVGRGPMRLFTVPVGPIVEETFERTASAAIVEELIEFSARRRGAALQLVVPCAQSSLTNGTYPELFLPPGRRPIRGLVHESAVAPAQFLLVDLERSEDQLMDSFRRNHRRNCRKSLRLGVRVDEAKTLDELRLAFSIIEANGVAQGYATRSWRDFGRSLQFQVERGHARVLIASHDSIPIGAHYGLVAGRRYSYVMGGNVRQSPDLLTGYLLQWKAMTLAHSMGLRAYDFTSDGTLSVLEFKRGFNPTRVQFHAPVHFSTSPVRLAAMQVGLPLIERNRALAARVLSRRSTGE